MGNVWNVIEFIIKACAIIGAIIVFVIFFIAVTCGEKNKGRGKNNVRVEGGREQVRYDICSGDGKCFVCDENIGNKYVYVVNRDSFYKSSKYVDLCWKVYCKLPASNKNYEFYEEFNKWRTTSVLFNEAFVETAKSLGFESHDDNTVSICEKCFRSKAR